MFYFKNDKCATTTEVWIFSEKHLDKSVSHIYVSNLLTKFIEIDKKTSIPERKFIADTNSSFGYALYGLLICIYLIWIAHIKK